MGSSLSSARVEKTATEVASNPKARINELSIGKLFLGGVVPGLLMFQPDFWENKEDWPFFWGENEYVIDICAAYIFLSNAVNEMLNK